MQVAYDKNMENSESPRRTRRRLRLIQLLAEVGGPTQAALETGTPKSHFSALVAGNRGVGDQLAEKLEKHYNKPVGWFDAETGEANLNFSSLKLDAFGTGPMAQRTKPFVAIELENNPEYPAIRRVKLKANAGVSGYSVDYSEDDDGPPIVFRADWFKLKGFIPERLIAVRVVGQSMLPKFSAGDIIVINRDDTTPRDGLIYLVSYEGEFTVKRMVRDAGEWWLSSDNPDQRRYPRKACNGDTTVIGKVVYHQTDNIDD